MFFRRPTKDARRGPRIGSHLRAAATSAPAQQARARFFLATPNPVLHQPAVWIPIRVSVGLPCGIPPTGSRGSLCTIPLQLPDRAHRIAHADRDPERPRPGPCLAPEGLQQKILAIELQRWPQAVEF